MNFRQTLNFRPIFVITFAVFLCGFVVFHASATVAQNCSGWTHNQSLKTQTFWQKANVSTVKTCIDAGHKVNARNTNRTTPLHVAAGYNDNPAVILALLDAGAQLNARNNTSNTPLHWAVWANRNPEVIAELLDAGANARLQNGRGQYPLDMLASNSNRNAITAHPVYWRLSDGRAESNSRPSVVTRPVVIRQNCTDWAHNKFAKAKAFWKTAKVATIRDCIEAGYKVNARNKSRVTPLHTAAAHNGDPAVITALLDAGAQLNARNNTRNTPLHWAVWANRNPEVIAELLDAGANVRLQNGRGQYPLDMLASNSNRNAITAHPVYWRLSDGRAESNSRYSVTQKQNCTGWAHNKFAKAKAFWKTAKANTVRACIEAGYKVNARNKSRTTPLHRAAEYNDDPAIITTLLDAGAKINARNNNGNTPLHTAAEYNKNPEIISTLLNAGANAGLQNNGGKYPFHLIENNSNKNAIKVHPTYWRLLINLYRF